MKRMQIVAFLIAVVFLQVLVALPFLVTQLGGTYATVGVLIGCSQLFYAGGSLLLHNFVQRFGQRRVLWVVFPSMTILTAGFAAVPSLFLLFLLVAVVSVVLALFWTSMECLFSSQEQDGGLVQRLSRYSMSWSFGDAVGAWLGAELVKIDLRVPFLVSAGLVLCCWGLLAWLERSGKLDRAYAPPAARDAALHGGERFLPATRTLMFFMFSIVGIMFAFVPLVIAREYPDWKAVSLGVIAVQPVVQSFVFVLLGLWTRWVHKSWMIWWCGLVAVAATLLVSAAVNPSMPPQAGAWCLRAGLGLVGASLAVSFLMNLLYSLERPESRARNSGIHEAIVGTGMMLGPVVAGFGARAAGRGVAAFWVAVGMSVLGFLSTQWIWLARCRRVQS